MAENIANLAFHHAAISVPDLEQAIDWYGRVLGFAVEHRFSIAAANAEAAMLQRDGLRVEIFEVAGAAALPEDRRSPHTDLLTHGHKHVAFQVPDSDRILESFQRSGIDVALVVREAFGTACFIRDCAGNLIEFVQR